MMPDNLSIKQRYFLHHLIESLNMLKTRGDVSTAVTNRTKALKPSSLDKAIYVLDDLGKLQKTIEKHPKYEKKWPAEDLKEILQEVKTKNYSILEEKRKQRKKRGRENQRKRLALKRTKKTYTTNKGNINEHKTQQTIFTAHEEIKELIKQTKKQELQIEKLERQVENLKQQNQPTVSTFIKNAMFSTYPPVIIPAHYPIGGENHTRYGQNHTRNQQHITTNNTTTTNLRSTPLIIPARYPNYGQNQLNTTNDGSKRGKKRHRSNDKLPPTNKKYKPSTNTYRSNLTNQLIQTNTTENLEAEDEIKCEIPSSNKSSAEPFRGIISDVIKNEDTNPLNTNQSCSSTFFECLIETKENTTRQH